jgi:nicotinamidase/pyrazinamidase
LFLRLAGIRLSVRADEPATRVSGAIIVVNHSSYLDGLLLLAALPDASRFVAKRELADMPVIGTFLRRLRVVFVERFAVRAGVEDAHRLARLAAQGESCIFFPEGTFVRTTGLKPFHLGAFAAAVEADRPIVPVALRGTRTLLPDGQWLPRRTPIELHIGACIRTPSAGNAFSATIQLRDAARRHILQYCDEPDLVGTPHEQIDQQNIRQMASPTFASPAAHMRSASHLPRLLRLRRGDALIVVDVQRDFLPGGNLPVPAGDAVIEPLNAYISAFDARDLPIVFTRDWYPPDHCSFVSNGGRWPPHCVQGTPGAAWAEGLNVTPADQIVSKGTEATAEAYSAFSGTNLLTLLRKLDVHRLFIGGLATDDCVSATVCDARAHAFNVVVLTDAVRALNIQPDDGMHSLQLMQSRGAKLFQPNAPL